ncbi:sigma-70 family RNA polymerase sigma factor [Umezawaea tangerina]|uniref:sigma-70 family RNA polymerase sigma factor n=1 Tax=Umezawaea tangerina TaxID=84725 RepID=UPI001B809412|nr:sigma-70 family RNA polymerase sigma factor [Umezawaea tangerina]
MRLLRCDDAEVTGLALRARAGDPGAVEGFVRATQGDVWRFVAHLAGDVQLADDLAQETYLRALPSLARFQGRSSARTWLLSIARRVVADHIRSVRVRPRVDGRDDWVSVAERAQPGQPGVAEGVVLNAVVASLEGERGTAFVLTQVLGLSYADAAEVCDCPVGTIRSRVARAREDLVGLLGEGRRSVG